MKQPRYTAPLACQFSRQQSLLHILVFEALPAKNLPCSSIVLNDLSIFVKFNSILSIPMSSALYTPLPADKFSIRLIKLQPSENTSAPVICKLITYPIASNGSRGHAYECLSYVWGLPEDRKPIHIDTGEAVVAFEATPNLYEALLHLRDPVFEQILWIDAICINQNDDEEKATQVAAMARIYGLAKRVVIWLGSEADGSALAFQRLKDLAQMQQTLDQPAPIDTSSEHGDLEKVRHRRLSSVDSEQAVHALLGRPYFRRMWVCQEPHCFFFPPLIFGLNLFMIRYYKKSLLLATSCLNAATQNCRLPHFSLVLMLFRLWTTGNFVVGFSLSCC